MIINEIWYEEFKIQRLFFRYIRETELERLKVTPQKLAQVLESLGLIAVSEDGKRYSELVPFLKFNRARDFKRLYEEPNGLLGDFYRGLRK